MAVDPTRVPSKRKPPLSARLAGVPARGWAGLTCPLTLLALLRGKPAPLRRYRRESPAKAHLGQMGSLFVGAVS